MRTGTMVVFAALVASLGLASRAGAAVRTFGDGDLPEILAVYDLNDDGILSQEEREAMRAGRGDRHDQWRDEWDTDGDGVISPEEREAARQALRQRREDRRLERFEEADTNGDGYLSFEEFSAIPAIMRLAAEHPEAPRTIFDGLDTDDDGQVSAEEFTLHLRERDRLPLEAQFRAADTNTNGTLSLAEFIAMPCMVRLAAEHPEAPAQMFENMDTDDSGELSLEEFLARPPLPPPPPRRNAFDDADTDGDGFLTFAEFSAMPCMVELERLHPGEPQRIFDNLDADDDALLSREEFLNFSPPRRDPFAIADADSDGFLTFAEFSAIPAMVELERMHPGAPREMFDNLDLDDDGRVSPEEFLRFPPPPPGGGPR